MGVRRTASAAQAQALAGCQPVCAALALRHACLPSVVSAGVQAAIFQQPASRCKIHGSGLLQAPQTLTSRAPTLVSSQRAPSQAQQLAGVWQSMSQAFCRPPKTQHVQPHLGVQEARLLEGPVQGTPVPCRCWRWPGARRRRVPGSLLHARDSARLPKVAAVPWQVPESLLHTHYQARLPQVAAVPCPCSLTV